MARKLIYDGSLSHDEVNWILSAMNDYSDVVEISNPPDHTWIEENLEKKTIWVEGASSDYSRETVSYCWISRRDEEKIGFLFMSPRNIQKIVDTFPDTIINRKPFAVKFW